MSAAPVQVGDKVRILPSAVDIYVDQEDVGKIAVVTAVGSGWDRVGDSILVKLGESSSTWTLRHDDYEKVVEEVRVPESPNGDQLSARDLALLYEAKIITLTEARAALDLDPVNQ